jgi:replicative DNA helicase
MSKSLYSPEIELSILAILLQHPETYVEIPFINSKDFSRQHSSIFAMISNIVENKGRPDEIIVAEKLKSVGITLDGIEVGDYCAALKIRPVDKRNLVDLAKALKKKTLVRTICNNAELVKKEVLENEDKSAKDLIGITDKYLGNSLVSLTGDEPEPINVFDVMPDIIEEYGEPEDTSNNLIMPHKSFRGAFGDLKENNIYFLIARSGGNKSTFLLDLCRQLPEANPSKKEELKILYLDSEMKINDLVLRYVAGKIGIPYTLIDNRQWKFDSHWGPVLRREMEAVKSMKNKNLYFEAIGNKTASELEKYVKRFYLNKVGRGNPFFIAYDYLKVTDADKKNNSKEHEVAYDKSQCMKEIADYCRCPLFSALQANRSGITTNKDASQIDDSENVASMSDRLSWLAAWMGILRKRTHDEMMKDSTPEIIASTHKLIDTKTRYFGKNGVGYSDFIRVKDGKSVTFKKNFINLNISNFSVEDRGTYAEQIILMGKGRIPLDKDTNNQPAF